MAISASEWLQWAIAFGVYPPDVAQGSVTEVDTGVGLIGGPITSTGILSFAPIAANSFWANVTGSIAVPTVQPLSSIVPSTLTSGQFFVGNASNVATGVGMSGDATLINTGAVTVSKIGGKAVSLAASFTTSGAFGLTLTVTGTSNATLPVGSTTLVPTTGTGATGVWSGITGLGVQSQALDMGTQLINNVVDPVSAQDVATKHYCDTTALNGTSVYAASAATLGTVTQSGAGVGATLTNAGVQATFALDGINPPLGSILLIKNNATGMTSANQGIYTLTNAGSGATNWVLTRATSYDSAIEINNTGLIVIQNGATLAGTAWYNAATIVTVDTTAFSYSQFGNIIFPITLANGGTGAALTASNGGIFYSNATTAAILAGTATAGLALLSGASTTPSWSASPPITRVISQIFTSGGTYTPTTGMKYCIVELVGGGGGGGGSATAAASGGAGGGGGAGGYARSVIPAATIGASQTVTIGAGGAGGAAGQNAGTAGGATSLGSLVVANGGGAGNGSPAVGAAAITSNGVGGGTATAGDFLVTGGTGGSGFIIAPTLAGIPGPGGASLFGQGGIYAGSSTGATGVGYGSGGSGALVLNGGSAAAGGAGLGGAIRITEFVSI